MGLNFRKSINLPGGFRINLSKSGVGFSWGVKGARVTRTANGKTKATLSIPGTGVSYTQDLEDIGEDIKDLLDGKDEEKEEKGEKKEKKTEKKSSKKTSSTKKKTTKKKSE